MRERYTCKGEYKGIICGENVYHRQIDRRIYKRMHTKSASLRDHSQRRTFDPDGMKKEKKESAVLDPLDGWGTRSAATTWQTGSSSRRTSDPVLYDRPLYGTRRDMYRKPSEMILVYHRKRQT